MTLRLLGLLGASIAQTIAFFTIFTTFASGQNFGIAGSIERILTTEKLAGFVN